MTTRIIGTVLFALMGCGAAYADSVCDGLSEVPWVHVIPSQVMVQFDGTPSSAQLEAASRTLNGYALAMGWHTNGLSTAMLQLNAELSMTERTTSSGVCVSLDKLDIKAGYDGPVKVQIANRYREGTCQYEAIRQHEMRHVQIYVDAVSLHLADIRAVIAGEIAGKLPVQGVDEDAAKAKINEIVRKATLRATDMVMVRAKRDNASIDTPESYAAVQSHCDSW